MINMRKENLFSKLFSQKKMKGLMSLFAKPGIDFPESLITTCRVQEGVRWSGLLDMAQGKS